MYIWYMIYTFAIFHGYAKQTEGTLSSYQKYPKYHICSKRVQNKAISKARLCVMYV